MSDIDTNDLDYKIDYEVDRVREDIDNHLGIINGLLQRLEERDEKIERLEARIENLENVVYSHKGGTFLKDKQ